MDIKLDKLLKVGEECVIHNGVGVSAWIAKRQTYNDKLNKWEETTDGVVCHVMSKSHPRGFLSLGESNDGKKFVVVPHAINQAKSFINTCKTNGYGTY